MTKSKGINIRWNLDKAREFIKTNSNCELLSNEFINSKSKLLFKCECGNEFTTTFMSFKAQNKRQCRECSNDNLRNIRKHSFVYIKRYIDSIGLKYVDGNYLNEKSELLVECNCGEKFITDFDKIKNHGYHNCRKCRNKKISLAFLKSNEEFEKDFLGIYLNKFKLVSKYKGDSKKVDVQCCACNNIFKRTPSNLLHKNRIGNLACPYCDGKMENNETFLYKLNIINKEIIPLEDYKGAHIPIKVKHDICGNEWFVTPSALINNKTSCPRCNESHMEKEITSYLKKMKIVYKREFKFNDCKNPKTKRKLPFDFYLPEFNICIEADGRQHYEVVSIFGGKDGFEIRKANDKMKNNFCEHNNIKLLRIPYWELDNIESILKSALI